MLSYKHRFHGHNSLRYVYKNGRPVRSAHMTLRATKNPKRKHSRFAVVVSKKVMKSAVGRNRIRRRLYEILRRNLDHISPAHDVVLLVSHPDIRTVPAVELEELVVSQLTQAKIYKIPL